MQIEWFEFQDAPGMSTPKWLRSAGLDEEGVLFAPAAVVGNEREVILAASSQNIDVTLYLKHAYLPVDWLLTHYPDYRPMFEKLHQTVTAFVEQNQPTSVVTEENQPVAA